jgi:hypothetical protein
MRRILLIIAFGFVCAVRFTFAQTDKVVHLEPVAGEYIEYQVSELLRVEFEGDSIRFIAADGTLMAEVYKYDYTRLEVVKKSPADIAPTTNDQRQTAQKVLINGQVYILLGDKLFTIQGASAR